MDLDLPVFDLRPLKRSFFSFIAVNFIIAVSGILIPAVMGDVSRYRLLDKINTWVLFLVLFVVSYLYSSGNKADLKKISEIKNPEDQFIKYETFYKRRLIWSSFSLSLSALLFILTMKNVFFYVLIIQLLLSIVFYPRKSFISKELNNNDIVFT